MDRKTIYDKLSEMSLDPPTEFPRTQRLNRPITYREACIDYVKKTMRCVGYRDYVVAELEKIEKIEQIFNEWTKCGDNADAWAYKQIREVLKNE